MPESITRGYIENFLGHAKFTNYSLRGKLLVIGPALNCADLFPVIPDLERIKSVSLVSDIYAKDELSKTANAFLKGVDVTIYGKTKFQSLNNQYDNILFWGAYRTFFTLGEYKTISKLLSPNGVFYGTFDGMASQDDFVSTHDSTYELYPQIESHPAHNSAGYWNGLVISKS